MQQVELFTAVDTPRRRRDAALGKLSRAHAGWISEARSAVLGLRGEFTSDDVWPLVKACPEPRAMGAVMQQLRREGEIVPTGRYITSCRSENHGRPVLVWVRAR